jgi:hypothetical protein
MYGDDEASGVEGVVVVLQRAYCWAARLSRASMARARASQVWRHGKIGTLVRIPTAHDKVIPL